MSPLTLLIFILSSMFFLACAVEKTGVNEPIKKVSVNDPAKPPDSKPILEVSQNAIGNWAVQGRLLTFRLYDDGVAEFEYVDQEKKKGRQNLNVNEVKSSRLIRISDTRLDEYMKLISTDEFTRSKEKYQAKCCCTDASMEFDINTNGYGQPKKITIGGICSDTIKPDPVRLPEFPQALYDLFDKIETDRARELIKN
jgi:hypothetical protein